MGSLVALLAAWVLWVQVSAEDPVRAVSEHASLEECREHADRVNQIVAEVLARIVQRGEEDRCVPESVPVHATGPRPAPTETVNVAIVYGSLLGVGLLVDSLMSLLHSHDLEPGQYVWHEYAIRVLLPRGKSRDKAVHEDVTSQS